MTAGKTYALGLLLVIVFATSGSGMVERGVPVAPPLAAKSVRIIEPWVLTLQGDTTWIQPYADTTHCPGDPLEGHGGEATGGPDGSRTWCFEGGPGDTCGTVAPWDILCFDHEDVRALPSMTGINYWHLDTYRCDERVYCDSLCLWCGSDSIWEGDGWPVECGSWVPGYYPGYGNQWNCIVQLDLDSSFAFATGCTLAFDPRYDTECKYDYFYVDFWDGSIWETLALFNASSDNPGNECGQPTGGNPDYWGNTDSGQPNSCAWQTRTDPNKPAFYLALDDTLIDQVSDAPSFRWRFTSDGAWSDADGRGNTDGACYIDNVWVIGDPGNEYKEDFEDGSWDTLAAHGWSLPDPTGIAQGWHIVHDPDPPYEGGDGGDRTTCTLDSSFVWRGRPENGYPGWATWRNSWFYRLKSPAVPITNSGCVVQYDQFMCIPDQVCDRTDTKVRFYDGVQNKWCPWINIDGYVLVGGCFFWNFDREEDVTPFYGGEAESMMFGFDLLDTSAPTDFCHGLHKEPPLKTENIIDNVSIGFFDGNATIFRARGIDILQDSFHDSVPAYNSQFDAYSLDTLDWYSGPPYSNPIKKVQQLYLDVSDKDSIRTVLLIGTLDRGDNWIELTMAKARSFDPEHPDLGGEYYGTFYPTDFSLTRWAKGTEVWYYVKCEDQDGTPGNYAYFPATADPADDDHTGLRGDYFTFSIMPMYPDTSVYKGVRILLVDGYPRRNYDYTNCMAADDNIVPLEDMYENTLIDAGYCYDKYDISGGGSNVHVHPLQYTDYDAVVWFTGPYFSTWLFDKEAQVAIRAYLAGGGKMILAGDRIAKCMAPTEDGGSGEDSLGGEFLTGIMGCDYQGEMESHFTKPYVYLSAVPSIDVALIGRTETVDLTGLLDQTIVYRECPYLKDQSYVVANGAPPTGYVPQSLLTVDNSSVGPSDGAIYCEKDSIGQLVYINYDLCGFVNHTRTACDGSAPLNRPTFTAGTYDGRVELIKVILNDIFNLASSGTKGGTSDTPKTTVYRWALSQNAPNPAAAGTEIRFEIARTSDVSIKVFNAMGQLVRTLENRRVQPGRYSVHWDGTNTVGEKVSSGVYFYKMETAYFSATRKMLILK